MAIRITGLNSGMDTDSIVQELVSANRLKVEKYEKAQTKLQWTQDTWKDMNTKIYGFYSKSLSNMRLEGSFAGKNTTTVSDSTKAIVVAGSSVDNGTQTLEVNSLATAAYLTGTQVKEGINRDATLAELGISDGQKLTLQSKGKTQTLRLSKDMKVSEFLEKLEDAGLSAKFDVTNRRFFINSGVGGTENDFAFTASGEEDLAVLEKLGIATEQNYQESGKAVPTDRELAVKSAAENAEIVLNGATFKSSSNEFKINGLTITATAKTTSPVTITTATDVDGIYNMIKDFLKEYNTVMNAMETAYNADSAKGYEPLTDDEKSEMSDEQVEKWEKKIKDSLLRRDGTLSSIMSGMSSVMSKSYEIDGKKYALSSFGIATTGYFNRVKNESYAYHIDGDQDDSITEGKDDKLKKAIAEDPEAVMKFFTKLSADLYENLDSKMKSTSLRSSYTVYNDKQMKKEYDEYTETIKKWEEKLADIEDRYYKQFATMERLMGEMQSQTSSLGSLFGGGM